MNHTQFCYWLGGFFELTENVDNRTLTKIKQKHKELVDSGKHAEFCYWLQGYFELNPNQFSDSRMLVIKDHLKVVFNKQTPDRGFFTAPVTDGRPDKNNLPWVIPHSYLKDNPFNQPKIVC